MSKRKLRSHSFFWLIISVLVSLCTVDAWSQVPAWAQNEPVMPFVEISSKFRMMRTWLVAGQVVSVTRTPEETLVTIDIDHVFAGPAELRGQRFNARFTTNLFRGPFYASSYLEAFAAGQRLITPVELETPWWDAAQHENPNAGALKDARGYGFPFPTLLNGSQPSRLVEAHAQAIEAVVKAPAEKRLGMMENYARASLPITTHWAIASLGRVGGDDGEMFLKQLAKEAHRLPQQLSIIDRELSRGRDPKGWAGSSEHFELLMRIATASQWEDGGEGSLSDLLYASSPHSVGQNTPIGFLNILKLFVKNATVSPKWRFEAINRVNWLMTGGFSKADALAFWSSLLRESQDVEVAQSCAQELANNAPWSGEQREKIKAIATDWKARKLFYKQPELVAKTITALEKAARQ